MKQTELIMGMPITVEMESVNAKNLFKSVFDYFRKIDARYSTYKVNSEITKINNGLDEDKWSAEMQTVMALCEQTRQDSGGFFNITHGGKRDPSGLVKGWSIYNAAQLLISRHVPSFYIEAGGDIQVSGFAEDHKPWKIGIRNPFKFDEIIKVISVSTEGVATSGTYIRGQHIYNPFLPGKKIEDVKSLTVIGPNIYEADRFATAAFAMGVDGINFIENMPGLEGYMVTADNLAIYTNGFDRYVENA